MPNFKTHERYFIILKNIPKLIVNICNPSLMVVSPEFPFFVGNYFTEDGRRSTSSV